MLNFILFIMIVAGGVGIAQLFNRVRELERRLRAFELEALNKADAGQGAPPAMVLQPTVPPVRRAATIVQPPKPAFEEKQPEPIAVPEPAPVPIEDAPEPVAEAAPIAAYSAAAETVTQRMDERPEREETYQAPSFATQKSGLSINFEELFGRRLPIWAGGITLAIAGVFIVQYAIDIGLFGRIFTPAVQAIMGAIFGIGLIGGGEWAHQRQDKVDDPRVPQALSGAGISTLYAAVLVASNVYGLVPAGLAFVLMALITAGALALSLRHGIASAVLGLAGGLAAPALTVGLSANVPMLSVYLALTIAGMVWVSRAQRWAWLGIAAMTGGAMWSALLILLGDLSSGFSVLSIGGFVLLLALALPAMTRDEDAEHGAWWPLNLRAIAAMVGAAQLALLVATGGFAMLNWGLYALIALAGQAITLPPLAARFAEQAKELAVLPRVSAALAILLLLIWPDAETGQLVTVALAMAAIHIPAMLYRLWWPKDAGESAALELSIAALSIAIIYARHFGHSFADGLEVGTALALCAGAALVALGAALGWNRPERHGDMRFVLLISVAGGLLMLAMLSGMPAWQAPIGFAAISAAWFGLGRYAKEARVDRMAAVPMGLSLLMIIAASPSPIAGEVGALFGNARDGIDGTSIARWGAVAALAALFAWQLRVGQWQRNILCAIAALLGYGVAAQIVPMAIMPIMVAATILGLAVASGKLPAFAKDDRRALWPAMAALAGVAAAWMLLPIATWAALALPSLTGEPMVISGPYLTLSELARRIIGPLVLLAGGLWLVQGAMPHLMRRMGWTVIGVAGAVAAHSVYRIGFGAAFGGDFVSTGLLQRFGWDMVLAGGALALWRFGKGEARDTAAPALLVAALAHLTTYSLLLHNPLWAEQSVGPWPLVNFIAPLFAALPLGLYALSKLRADAAEAIGRILQPIIMAMVALAAWATLRHAFHGAILVGGGLAEGESIARSLLGLALAVGFLLWGIRTQSREWRIASLGLMLLSVGKVFLLDAAGLDGLARIGSFVALGFTLIGIGWLYARQLRRGENVAPLTNS